MNTLRTYTLNGQTVWQGQLNKINGQHLPQPTGYIIRPLHRGDASSMGELSADIYRHLNPGEECFIHQHQQSYYHSVFDNPDIHYIGIFKSNRLIGMSSLKLCRSQEDFAAEIPGSPINFSARRNSLVAALGADCVLPEYRGNSLNKIMISCRLQMAKASGCTDAASIIDRHNHWNMPPYFGNGFNMYATGVDPEDGGKIALMHHSINNPSSSLNRQPGISVPHDRFNLIDTLISKGYAGRNYNPSDGKITFTPAPEYQSLALIKPNMFTFAVFKGLSHV